MELAVIFLSTTTHGVATWLTVAINLLGCLLPFLFSFMFFIFNAPIKVKEDSILSEHLAFLFIVLLAILGVYCG